MKRWPVVAVTLAMLWLFLRGVSVTPARIAGEFLIGLAVGLPLAYAARRLYAPDIDLGHYLRASPYAALYVGVFLKDLVVANFDVAYRVLSPSMPIEPGVVVFPLRVRKDVAVTTIANSITLTPGTLTMDYDDERHALIVHAIDGRDPAALTAPIRQWEDYALVIFDEELKPGDPVPESDFSPNDQRPDTGRTDATPQEPDADGDPAGGEDRGE